MGRNDEKLANEVGPMNVSEALRDAMAHRNMSKNEMIRRTGIDRSTFFQILGGRRSATPAQFEKILEKLDPEPCERASLLQTYEAERVGEAVYAAWEKIRQFWKRLDALDAAGLPPQKAPLSCIGQAMEQAVSGPDPAEIRIFLPEDLLGRLGVFTDLARIGALQPDCEIRVAFLLAPAPESSAFETVLDNLPELLELVKAQNFRISAGSVPAGADQFAVLTPYPYFVLAGDVLILVSRDGSKQKELTDPSFVRDYEKSFAEALGRAGKVIDSSRDLHSCLQILGGCFQRFAGPEIYLLDPTPCIDLSITDEELRRYLQDDTLLSYKHLLEQTGVREFSTKTGMQQLVGNGNVAESGVHIRIQPEDVPVLAENLKARLGKNLFLLSEETVTVPRDWSMYVLGEEMLIIVPHDDNRFLVAVSSRKIAEKFAGWFHSRLSMVNADLLTRPEP